MNQLKNQLGNQSSKMRRPEFEVVPVNTRSAVERCLQRTLSSKWLTLNPPYNAIFCIYKDKVFRITMNCCSRKLCY